MLSYRYSENMIDCGPGSIVKVSKIHHVSRTIVIDYNHNEFCFDSSRIFLKQKLLVENNLQVKVTRGTNYGRRDGGTGHFVFPDLPEHTTTCGASGAKVKSRFLQNTVEYRYRNLF